jgi:hypothetical protein
MNTAIPGAVNAGTPVRYTDQVRDETEKYRRLAVEAKEVAAGLWYKARVLDCLLKQYSFLPRSMLRSRI